MQYQVESFTQKGKFYIVRETPEGLRCSCPAFVFNDKQNCKHIEQVLKKEKVYVERNTT